MSGNAYVSHPQKIIVFWSPKCACTSVVTWFCKTLLEEEEISGDARGWLLRNGLAYNYFQCRYAGFLRQRTGGPSLALTGFRSASGSFSACQIKPPQRSSHGLRIMPELSFRFWFNGPFD